MRIGIIGGGRVGSCLAGYFADAGLLVGITAGSAEHSAQLAEENGTIDSSTAHALRCLLGGKHYETSHCSDH